ncbi:MAG TPA: metalloregulator ArsR/SmtB family transcription factor [Thermoanaerobaculia bacterium]|nr:metalloregulator ArsR/SmtB family transcription factor [Thermoanaerobaculia bacterium]
MKAAARIFQALADPTRRQILQELEGGELSAGEIVSRFSISAPAISRHLSILETAALVSQRREGNRIYYDLEPETLAGTLGDFLSAVCPTQIVQRRQIKKRRTS